MRLVRILVFSLQHPRTKKRFFVKGSQLGCGGNGRSERPFTNQAYIPHTSLGFSPLKKGERIE